MPDSKPLKLGASLKAWGRDDFNAVFSKEVCALDTASLPLQQGLTHSSYAITDDLSISVLNSRIEAGLLIVKAGLSYTGIIAGCNCADDPSPVDKVNEYCEALFYIDSSSGETTITLFDE